MLPSKATAASRGTVTASSSQAAATFTIRAIPMPPTILEYILDNISVLRRLQRDRDMLEERTLGSEALDLEEEQPIDVQGDVERTPTVKPENYWTTLQERCQQVGGDWADLADRIWAFGPHGAGGCLLIDSRVSSPPNS
jgi:ribosome assembly protein 1